VSCFDHRAALETPGRTYPRGTTSPTPTLSRGQPSPLNASCLSTSSHHQLRHPRLLLRALCDGFTEFSQELRRARRVARFGRCPPSRRGFCTWRCSGSPKLVAGQEMAHGRSNHPHRSQRELGRVRLFACCRGLCKRHGRFASDSDAGIEHLRPWSCFWSHEPGPAIRVLWTETSVRLFVRHFPSHAPGDHLRGKLGGLPGSAAVLGLLRVCNHLKLRRDYCRPLSSP
jgi:hypothetical protein